MTAAKILLWPEERLMPPVRHANDDFRLWRQDETQNWEPCEWTHLGSVRSATIAASQYITEQQLDGWVQLIQQTPGGGRRIRVWNQGKLVDIAAIP